MKKAELFEALLVGWLLRLAGGLRLDTRPRNLRDDPWGFDDFGVNVIPMA